ncbi:hypothetical protein F4825DRAFT_442958 [Nemania diffusa]|nr:hypothetical protein F4825DRAFT_442958 [Nemania diffusa]
MPSSCLLEIVHISPPVGINICASLLQATSQLPLACKLAYTTSHLSIEAIIAIVGVVVSLPPTVLVFVQYIKRRGSHLRANRIEVLPRTTLQFCPRPRLRHVSRQPFYAFDGRPNIELTYGSIEEQYSLTRTVTPRRANSYHPS